MAVPSYIEDSAKDFATQAATAYKTPLQPSTFMGDQYVAPMDPLQTSAISMAQQGVGSYEPYLQQAQTGVTAAREKGEVVELEHDEIWMAGPWLSGVEIEYQAWVKKMQNLGFKVNYEMSLLPEGLRVSS